MEKVAVVSSADQKYYPLLLECLESVKRSWSAPETQLSLCAIGCQLSQEQVQELVERDIQFAELRNDFSVSQASLRDREYLLTTLVRACLPDYFPGYDIYIWMDADSWVCDFSAIALYLQAARQGKMGVVANFDRYTKQSFTADAWFLKWAKIRNFYLKNASRSGLSHKEVQYLACKPCLYSGNFSLPVNAPHWHSYQQNLHRVVNKGRVFGSDQLALGMSIYLDEHPLELLPRWCNWTSVDKPKYDADNACFVEPYLPHYKIGIMHLAGQDLMRMDMSCKFPIEDLAGNSQLMSLRYQSVGDLVK